MRHAVFPRKSNDDANAMAPSSVTRAISNASMNRIHRISHPAIERTGNSFALTVEKKRDHEKRDPLRNAHQHHTTTAYNRPFRFVYTNDQNNSLTKH